MKTAIVIGATGMVGAQLVRQLLADAHFSRVITFVRRPAGIVHGRLEEHVVDFEERTAWEHLVVGDVLFSALGTTLKQAGSKDIQYKVDYTYQYWFAEAAALHKVPVYVLVSSASANPESRIFYTRMKGELERDIKKLPFESIVILQPGLLWGKRDKERLGEKLAYTLLTALNSMGLLKSYRPVQAEIVAAAMLNAGIAGLKGVHVFTLAEVFGLAEKKIPVK